MVDTKGLLVAIKVKGLKKQYIADELHMNIATLYRKIRGTSDFTSSEIVKMCELLGIQSSEETERLFLGRSR